MESKREVVVVVTREVNSSQVTVVLVPLVLPHSSPTLSTPYPVSVYTYSRKMADVKDPKIAEGKHAQHPDSSDDSLREDQE